MLPHTLITASAGSGKTWSLTVRYLRLLMLGAAPESIVALTFSRKAAGEFFNAILHRLAEAAAGTDAAAVLAKDIERPGTTREEFCQALVRMTSGLPFLMLGTLDSFFIRMARSFPFELGLAGDFTMLDPHQQSVEKMRVYERVFAPESGPATARTLVSSSFWPGLRFIHSARNSGPVLYHGTLFVHTRCAYCWRHGVSFISGHISSLFWMLKRSIVVGTIGNSYRQPKSFVKRSDKVIRRCF